MVIRYCPFFGEENVVTQNSRGFRGIDDRSPDGERVCVWSKSSIDICPVLCLLSRVHSKIRRHVCVHFAFPVSDLMAIRTPTAKALHTSGRCWSECVQFHQSCQQILDILTFTPGLIAASVKRRIGKLPEPVIAGKERGQERRLVFRPNDSIAERALGFPGKELCHLLCNQISEEPRWARYGCVESVASLPKSDIDGHGVVTINDNPRPHRVLGYGRVSVGVFLPMLFASVQLGGTKTWSGCAVLFGGILVSASLPFGLARLATKDRNPDPYSDEKHLG
ncbi:MAG: hypothetical protein ACI8W8_002391 [Rhodothermales bacterium]|jgi:hypothetical protein